MRTKKHRLAPLLDGMASVFDMGGTLAAKQRYRIYTDPNHDFIMFSIDRANVAEDLGKAFNAAIESELPCHESTQTKGPHN